MSIYSFGEAIVVNARNSLEHHWMPFTANREFKSSPRLLCRAEGMNYWNHNGDRVLDGCSGLFCCAAGHGRQAIADAIAKQLKEMDYGPHFQLGHPLSFELADRLAELTPGDLNYIFFTNSGSEAVDTALKIAMAFHRARGEGQRLGFVSRQRAYHGVNIGGTSLSGMVRNRSRFAPLMPGVAFMRDTWMPESRFTKGQPDIGLDLAEDLQRLVDLYGPETIAACFVEPIAGSTGVLVPPKGYLQRLREICTEHSILLVFDEVICGFGRTGKAFAGHTFEVVPDMMTMAKALTNGAQPMGAVAVSDDIYETITSAATDGSIDLFHGYTYSAHPAACAAAIGALNIYRDERLFDRAAELSSYFLDSMFGLSDLPIVIDIRGIGMLAGFDLDPLDRPGQRGAEAMKRLFAAGLHLRFVGDCGIVAPALIAERQHIDEITGILRKVLGSL